MSEETAETDESGNSLGSFVSVVPVSSSQEESSWDNEAAGDVPEEPLDDPPDAPEEVLTPKTQIRIPVGDASSGDNIQFTRQDDLISLTAQDAALSSVLGLIAEQHGLNLVTGDTVTEKISVQLKDVPLRDALDALLLANGYTWAKRNDILIISKVSGESRGSPVLQGREVRVFTLNYVAAADVDKVVQGLLSPVGQSFTNQSAATDQRRTQEQVVVEDLPVYLERIAEYVASVDVPPRQVLVEAHVLEVDLDDSCRHGVDIEHLLSIANSSVSIEAAGFAPGTTPAALLTLEGDDLDLAIEAIKSTTDAKTLASPKVAVLNGQEARIQVGGRIGYLLTTTTQTSTLQSVDFLDVGVILRVTPIITEDNQVMMQVNPQVSTGRINATTQLPESETTEVETRILLADGEALLIGGLIKETDIDTQSKIPLLGDVWMLGRLFQRREVTRQRSEYIVTLLPRIVPDAPGCRSLNPQEVEATRTPLLDSSLRPVDRSHLHPQLPDAARRKRRHPSTRPGKRVYHPPPVESEEYDYYTEPVEPEPGFEFEAPESE